MSREHDAARWASARQALMKGMVASMMDVASLSGTRQKLAMIAAALALALAFPQMSLASDMPSEYAERDVSRLSLAAQAALKAQTATEVAVRLAELAKLEKAEEQAKEEADRLADAKAKGIAAAMSDAEVDAYYPLEYYYQRLKDLGYYKETGKDADLLRRDAIVRLQAANNMMIDAKLGRWSKLALFEHSPMTPVDEIAEPASDGFWITINKSYNILTVYKGATPYRKYPVATGSRPGLTPEGKFSFVSKAKNPTWGGGGYAAPVAGGSPRNPLGYRWMGLSIGGGGRYGVHGNASPYSIGTYASHGCVRMINADVEELYEYIEKGTPVWIGTSEKLKEFGVQQYFTVVEPIKPEPVPPSDKGPIVVPGSVGYVPYGENAVPTPAPVPVPTPAPIPDPAPAHVSVPAPEPVTAPTQAPTAAHVTALAAAPASGAAFASDASAGIAADEVANPSAAASPAAVPTAAPASVPKPTAAPTPTTTPGIWPLLEPSPTPPVIFGRPIWQ